MALILSSSFSLNMLDPDEKSEVEVLPVCYETAKEEIEDSSHVRNMVNPRHESTARLSELLCGKPAEGGMLQLFGEGGTLLVMLPPRELTTRSGEEIEVKDLEECQFFLVHVNKYWRENLESSYEYGSW